MAVKLDCAAASKLDRFGRIKTMDFRKVVTGGTNLLIHKYQYGYDANGNRTHARIKQAGSDPLDPGYNNDPSYVYGYDKLDRLTPAKRGVLNGNINQRVRDMTIGSMHELQLEPFAAHEQLNSIKMVLNEHDDERELFVDVSE